MKLAVIPSLNTIPEALRADVARLLQEIDTGTILAAPEDSAACALPRVLACSRFVARVLQRNPGLADALLRSGELERACEREIYVQRLTAALDGVADETAFKVALRRFRNREMVRIAWRDLGGLADSESTLRETSSLADAATDVTLRWLCADQSGGYGSPVDDRGRPQLLFVLGMGKLGGAELNFSSDIDLIFGYPRAGETQGGRRSISNQEFFDRLGRRLVKVLHEPTEDGFAFRVDMRLRPFGDSGALTQSMAAMESYYEAHARDWERYAMIKARVCAGDLDAGERFLRALQPFVYRRYVDFGALQALREMKALINSEVARGELRDDIKRGPGGIREIEFIAQSFQLIRGGREPALRVRSTRAALNALGALEELPAQAVQDLQAAYVFLRNTEQRLQQLDDRQTHTLPEEETERTRIALGMGFEAWEEFEAALHVHRQHVETHFARLLENRNRLAGTISTATSQLVELWAGRLTEEQAIATLNATGFENPGAALEEIDKLRLAQDIGRLSAHGQERLSRLMPMVLGTVAGGTGEIVAVQRIFRLLETVARRSVYLSLLAEQPQALQQLARLFAASPWIANYIAQHPILLDELLDARALYAPPGAAALEKALRNEIAKHAPADLEHQMDALRHFRHAEVLKVAAADLTGHLALPEVSNHLSWIAETVLRVALDLAWGYLTERHGRPQCGSGADGRPAGFAVIAYGKLGGLELGYGSDLDLVFLHDSAGEEQLTDGVRPIDNSSFFTRLAQRLIHLISTFTPAGLAYEVDTRLRPSGESGLMVSSLEAFGKYQREQAWTWEHQALVRARFVAGHSSVAEGFRRIRNDVLGRQRDRAVLRRDILDMRSRMRQELASREAGVFDLKQGEGGMTDIEFMVQYGVLAHAAECPALLAWTDNLRLLEVFSDCGVLPAADCIAVREAYFAFRAETHRRALQEQPALAADSEFQEARSLVQRLWQLFVVEGA
ncbi:MAG: bifunctional [glutamate--ammonia ligase]-adenylyl-L-tyrosine phosphorylase/[glutamate--ammonia-ligase] adenylyltransferase [Chromatiales bacterium]